MDRSLGKVVRAVRHRLGWRQVDLARRAGVSRRLISKLERQGPAGFTVRTLRKICEPLNIDVHVYGRWRGGELDRLLDAGHAALQAAFTSLLQATGWEFRIEATFSRYGERGSIDILAFHPASRTLLVVEIKTMIADVQGLLRPIDVKVRLAREVAQEYGWNPRTVVACLVVSDETTARRRVATHDVLFSRFSLRGWAARRWLRTVEGTPSGVLLFLNPPNGSPGAVSRAGRQRVRRSHADSRSAATHPTASTLA